MFSFIQCPHTLSYIISGQLMLCANFDKVCARHSNSTHPYSQIHPQDGAHLTMTTWLWGRETNPWERKTTPYHSPVSSATSVNPATETTTTDMPGPNILFIYFSILTWAMILSVYICDNHDKKKPGCRKIQCKCYVCVIQWPFGMEGVA